jgi:hypothetical protein
MHSHLKTVMQGLLKLLHDRLQRLEPLQAQTLLRALYGCYFMDSSCF